MSTDDKTRIVSAAEGVGPGTQLNGIFEIDELIAFGGMGEVYRGHNIQTDDPVAIKIVLPEFARDKTMLALFRKEASILSHLVSDAIIRYHVFTIDPAIGRPYLAMEYVDGQSLADVIAHGPMSPEKVARLVIRIASGLSAAHAAGVIHRDLSPDNIILPGGKVNKAKIIDFGIAKSANVGGGTLLGGKFAGKYNFVSPEQLGDFGGEITARSDIYSLGLVMAAALRGEALDMGGSQVEVIEKRRRMPDVSALDETLSPILEAMLQPDPEARPPSMDAIVEWMTAAAHALGADGYETVPQPMPYRPGERSIPPRAGPAAGGSAPVADRSVPPAGGSKPPLPVASAPPLAVASIPPLQGGSVPPAGESPFGGWQGAPAAGASLPPLAAPKGGSRTGIYAAAAVVVLALAGGGAWMGGLFSPGEPEGGSDVATLTPAPAPAPAAPAGGGTAAPDAASAPGEPEAPEAPAETAMARPDQPTPPPAETLDNAASRVAWLDSYGGGSCFYATATNVSDNSIDIEGFGTSPEPFETMLDRFKQVHKVEPNVGVRLIEQQQCAVADFLQALRTSSADKPDLALSSDLVRSGQALRGTLGNLEGRQTEVLLVDNAGVVYNLGAHLKESGEGASFNIKLGLSTDQPVPQMIIAVASPNGLDSAKVDQPVLAATLFPKILDEIQDKNVAASATAKYFKLGG